jgi:hypothetical protein
MKVEEGKFLDHIRKGMKLCTMVKKRERLWHSRKETKWVWTTVEDRRKARPQ